MMLAKILMLEDDSDDRYITENAIAELNIPAKLTFLSNSNDFLQFLAEATDTSLILLDFNSTPENGIDVLRRLKADPRFRHIPVVILGDSQLKRDRDTCYENGASTYIQKPRSIEETTNKIATFFRYWLEVAEL